MKSLTWDTTLGELTKIMKIKNNIREAFASESNESSDRAAITVEMVLTIAGLAIVAIALVAWLGTAILNKGADVAVCIESANTYVSSAESEQACKDGDTKNKSFKQTEQSYKDRYK